MVVDGLEVFGLDFVPGDAVFLVEGEGEVADDVFDELGVVEGLLGDEFFIGAFKDGVDGGGGGGLHNFDEVLDPEHAFEADAGGDFAALIVGTVHGNFFGAGAKAGGGGADAEDEVVGAVGGAFESADVIHEALGAGDGGGFFDEVGEGHFDVGIFGVEPGFHFVEDGDDAVGGDGLVMLVEDFEEARHVRAFFVLGERDVEVDHGDGVLFAAAGLAEGDGVADGFDADLVDGDVAGVGGALDVGHTGLEGGGEGGGFGHEALD